MSRDWNSLAPSRYKCGLTSGHLFDGRCQEEESAHILGLFERKFNPKGERRSAIVLQDIDKRRITRSDKLCWFLAMGKEVFLRMTIGVVPIVIAIRS